MMLQLIQDQLFQTFACKCLAGSTIHSTFKKECASKICFITLYFAKINHFVMDKYQHYDL